jgi:hypothetical protein
MSCNLFKIILSGIFVSFPSEIKQFLFEEPIQSISINQTTEKRELHGRNEK